MFRCALQHSLFQRLHYRNSQTRFTRRQRFSLPPQGVGGGLRPVTDCIIGLKASAAFASPIEGRVWLGSWFFMMVLMRASTTFCSSVVMWHEEHLQVKEDVGPDDGELMLDNLWSMQYRVPGPLCAFAGPVASPIAGDEQADLADFTHGLHFRFSSSQVWAFEQGSYSTILNLFPGSDVPCMTNDTY